MDITSAFDLDSRLTDVQRTTLRRLAIDDERSAERDYALEFHQACAARLTRNIVMNYVASEALQHEMSLSHVLVENFDGLPGSIIHKFHAEFRRSCEAASQQIQYDAAKHIMLTIRALLHEMGVGTAVFNNDQQWQDECLMALTPQPSVESIPVGEDMETDVSAIAVRHDEWLEIRRQWIDRLTEFAPTDEKKEKIRSVAERASINDVIHQTDVLFNALLREHNLQPEVLPLREPPPIRLRENGDEEAAA